MYSNILADKLDENGELTLKFSDEEFLDVEDIAENLQGEFEGYYKFMCKGIEKTEYTIEGNTINFKVTYEQE